MIETALTIRPVDNLTYPFAHPLHVLNLAREVDAPILIPSAIYFRSIYPLVDFIKGDHPKLLVEHPSRPSAELLSSDLLSYTGCISRTISCTSSANNTPPSLPATCQRPAKKAFLAWFHTCSGIGILKADRYISLLKQCSMFPHAQYVPCVAPDSFAIAQTFGNGYGMNCQLCSIFLPGRNCPEFDVCCLTN